MIVINSNSVEATGHGHYGHYLTRSSSGHIFLTRDRKSLTTNQNGETVLEISDSPTHSEKFRSKEELQETELAIAIQGSMQDFISLSCNFRQRRAVSDSVRD